MIEASTPIEIFCSYVQEDETWLQKLEAHLSLLRKQRLVSLRYDRLIVPGTDRAKAIGTYLETASIILLLVSANFLDSDYCYGVEMKRALERHAANEARVVPILVRQVDWKHAPFAHLHVLPTDARPLASWQDEDTALADVAAGIRRVIEDLPLLAASAPRANLPPIWNIPYSHNLFFLGRESELSQIHRRLHAGQATYLSQPQAISGLGGIGKTQLALAYAYRYHQEYTAVLWAHAESTEALVSSYVALARHLHLPEREAKEQDIIVQSVKIWLQNHRNWLLILDNADELALLPDFLSPGWGGHVLLTTRATATGRQAYRLEIKTLEPAQGALFLLRRSGLIAPDTALEQALSQEQKQAVQISQELGGLPLALDQAGAYLEETGTDLAGYWQIYQERRDDLLKKRGELVGDHPASVATTWSVSFQRVEERNPVAADLLRMLAFLAPDAIPEEILTAGASKLGPALTPVAADAFLLNQAIEALRAYSLVQRDPTERSLSVHRLVQAVLQDGQKREEQCLWAKRAILAVNAAFPDVKKYEMWLQCERLLPHALLAAQFIEKFQIICPEAGRLLYLAAWCVKEHAYYQQAEQLYQQALSIQKQALGLEHLEVARSLNGLSLLYSAQERYAEAEPHYQHALDIFEQQLGPDHPEVAYPLTSLGSLYCAQRKYAEAEVLLKRALSIREQRLGPDDYFLVARTLTCLGTLYRDQRKYVEAEPFYQQALNIREQRLRPENPETAEVMHEFAQLRKMQGKSEEASDLYACALAIRKQVLGHRHPDTTRTRNCLKDLFHCMGRHEEAVQLEP
jgi:tetratricopeptide (TPR) repeat protein